MIYELIYEGIRSPDLSRRIVAAIIDNLNDRRGIKQELQACDAEEIFETLTKIVSAKISPLIHR